MNTTQIQILLVEDDPEYAYLLQEMLKTVRSSSFDVTHADQLSIGLVQSAAGSFDAILLDLTLPDSWGFQTFVRMHAQAPDVPIIVLSGLGDRKLALRAIRAGAQDYLDKAHTDSILLVHAIRHAIERKRAEQMRTRQELNRLRSELIVHIAHELSPHLESIKAECGLLLAQDADRDIQQKQASAIAEGADKLRAVIDNLLELSRMDQGQLHLEKRPTDIGQLARELVQTIETRATHHRFVLDLPAHPLTAMADAKRIEQVLRNLLTNAINTSPDGGTITVQARGDNSHLFVRVSDEGTGIPPHELEGIFEQFQLCQIKNKVTHQMVGTGLELAVSRGIVEAHGGRIGVESALGQGNTFYFTLEANGHTPSHHP